MGIYQVLLGLYLVRLGYGPEFVGLVYAIWGLTNALASLPAGLLMRRFSLRRTMIGGACLSIATLFLVPLAEILPQAARGAWITVVFGVTGLSFALLLTAIGPFIMMVTTDQERDHAFAAYYALIPLGGFLGSMVGGALPRLFASLLGVSIDAPAPYRYPLLLGALLCLPGLAALIATREHARVYAEKTLSEAGRGPLGLVTVIVGVIVLQGVASFAPSTFFNIYMDTDLNTSTARIGVLIGVAQLLSVPAPLLVPALVARWDRRKVIGTVALGTALSALLLALIPHWAGAGLGFVGVTALMMMWMSAIQPYVMTLVSPQWQATVSGATNLAMGVGSSVVAFAGGYIAAALGFPTLFLIGTGVTGAGVLLFWAYFRGPRGEPALT
jgi:MFS family permease